MSATRLSPLDSSFLEVETPDAHMHVGWVAIFSRPEGAGRAQLRAAARPHRGPAGRAPRYRQKLATVPFGLNDPLWIDDEDFDVERHVRRTTATSSTASSSG